jgi:hypothetical protein
MTAVATTTISIDIETNYPLTDDEVRITGDKLAFEGPKEAMDWLSRRGREPKIIDWQLVEPDGEWPTDIPTEFDKPATLVSDRMNEEFEHIKQLLRNHKCRVDRRKPAGGGVCDVCQAMFALDSLKDNLIK